MEKNCYKNSSNDIESLTRTSHQIDYRINNQSNNFDNRFSGDRLHWNKTLLNRKLIGRNEPDIHGFKYR